MYRVLEPLAGSGIADGIAAVARHDVHTAVVAAVVGAALVFAVGVMIGLPLHTRVEILHLQGAGQCGPAAAIGNAAVEHVESTVALILSAVGGHDHSLDVAAAQLFGRAVVDEGGFRRGLDQTAVYIEVYMVECLRLERGSHRDGHHITHLRLESGSSHIDRRLLHHGGEGTLGGLGLGGLHISAQPLHGRTVHPVAYQA